MNVWKIWICSLLREAHRATEGPYLTQELEGTIRFIKKGKTPAPGGITEKLCQEFSSLMLLRLLKICSDILQVNRIPKSWFEAYIVKIMVHSGSSLGGFSSVRTEF